jgi:DnaJ-class molecular chaperone
MTNLFDNESSCGVCTEERPGMEKRIPRTRLSQRIFKNGSESNVNQWECPYCRGIGIDPYSPTGIKNCPACHGKMFWESEVKYTDLEHCDSCQGKGKIDNEGNWRVCPDCKGAGRG